MYNNTNSFKYRQCSDILSSHVNFHEMLKEISRVAEQKFALGAGACVTVGFVVVDRLDVDQGVAELALLELVEDVHTPVLLHHVLVHVDPARGIFSQDGIYFFLKRRGEISQTRTLKKNHTT